MMSCTFFRMQFDRCIHNMSYYPLCLDLEYKAWWDDELLCVTFGCHNKLQFLARNNLATIYCCHGSKESTDHLLCTVSYCVAIDTTSWWVSDSVAYLLLM